MFDDIFVKKINIKSLAFLLSVFFVAAESASAKNNYQPYIQIGGTRFFHVQESNTAAVEFYKKMGFKQLERLENFYQQPTVIPPHALKMEITIE